MQTSIQTSTQTNETTRTTRDAQASSSQASDSQASDSQASRSQESGSSTPPVQPAASASNDGSSGAPIQDVDASPYPRFIEDRAIKGSVRCVGSSSVGLMLNTVRSAIRDSQPDIELIVESTGSSAGPKALAQGTADLAPMSRAMRPAEIAEIEKIRGAKVGYIEIAVDAIAICVNRENPMTRISLKDLDRVFGRERRRGGGPAIVWGDVGVRDTKISSQRIDLFGMGPGTGSNGIVSEVVLDGGPFRTSVNEEPVASSVVQAIATDPLAIGYCSAYFEAARVRQLEVEALDGNGFVAPTEANIRSGRYPLARSMRIYYVDDPKAFSPAARQFLRFLVSEDGQELITEMGQKALSPEQAHLHFNKLK
ncbi:MAG: PstS family phosphate ABC transporter substrate-binding protein [bacterium]